MGEGRENGMRMRIKIRKKIKITKENEDIT
jgi:hypothetical protein